MANEIENQTALKLQSAVQQKSIRLIQARFLEDTGRTSDALILYKQVAEDEEWIAREMRRVGRTSSEYAINLVSAASCWKKAGDGQRAQRLLDEVLAIQTISDRFREEVETLRNEGQASQASNPFRSKPVEMREAFDKLLNWLDPDRDRAGEKYENIRNRLIHNFRFRGVNSAEELTDQTIDRVLEMIKNTHGPVDYDQAVFFAVARNLYLESMASQRRKQTNQIQENEPPIQTPLRLEQEFECLEQCLEQLSPSHRELVLRYYQVEGQAKQDARKELARRLNMSLSSLRVRAHRIKQTLKKCVEHCQEEAHL